MSDEYIRHMWSEVLRFGPDSVDNIIAHDRGHPGDADSRRGAALERALSLGVSRDDLVDILWVTAYEGAFGALFALIEVETGDVCSLYADLGLSLETHAPPPAVGR